MTSLDLAQGGSPVETAHHSLDGRDPALLSKLEQFEALNGESLQAIRALRRESNYFSGLAFRSDIAAVSSIAILTKILSLPQSRWFPIGGLIYIGFWERSSHEHLQRKIQSAKDDIEYIDDPIIRVGSFCVRDGRFQHAELTSWPPSQYSDLLYIFRRDSFFAVMQCEDLNADICGEEDPIRNAIDILSQDMLDNMSSRVFITTAQSACRGSAVVVNARSNRLCDLTSETWDTSMKDRSDLDKHVVMLFKAVMSSGAKEVTWRLPSNVLPNDCLKPVLPTLAQESWFFSTLKDRLKTKKVNISIHEYDGGDKWGTMAQDLALRQMQDMSASEEMALMRLT